MHQTGLPAVVCSDTCSWEMYHRFTCLWVVLCASQPSYIEQACKHILLKLTLSTSVLLVNKICFCWYVSVVVNQLRNNVHVSNNLFIIVCNVLFKASIYEYYKDLPQHKEWLCTGYITACISSQIFQTTIKFPRLVKYWGIECPSECW